MKLVQYILVGGVRAYQLTLSPAMAFLLGPSCRCRYNPSCSEFAIQAIREHGAIAGGWFAVKRICRCHPWGGCGEDPVPRATRSRASTGAGKPDCSRCARLLISWIGNQS